MEHTALLLSKTVRYALKKKPDIIWEFFPNGGLGILGKFTKVLGFGKTPPHVGKISQIISFFFMRAYLSLT